MAYYLNKREFFDGALTLFTRDATINAAGLGGLSIMRKCEDTAESNSVSVCCCSSVFCLSATLRI